MLSKIVRCSNCGKISESNHILPVCNDCFKGLEDYESFLAKFLNNVEIVIDKTRQRQDDFLRV